MWPFKCFKLKCCNYLSNLNKRYRLYLKGSRKLTKELNVVSFLKMQRKIKTIMRLLMTRQQRLFASYSKLNKISASSDGSHSESSADLGLPKMLDSSKVKQEHCEAIDKLFDEHLQQKYTQSDFKILHEVYSGKELAEIKMTNEDINQNNLKFKTRKHNENSEQPFDLLSKSLNLVNMTSIDLLGRHEEHKSSSQQSVVDVTKLLQEANLDIVENFNHINYEDFK